MPNADRQRLIDVLNMACGENTGAQSLVLYQSYFLQPPDLSAEDSLCSC